MDVRETHIRIIECFWELLDDTDSLDAIVDDEDPYAELLELSAMDAMPRNIREEWFLSDEWGPIVALSRSTSTMKSIFMAQK